MELINVAGVLQEAEDADSRVCTRSQVSVEYNDVNKMTIAPLQLKIKNFFGKTHKLKNNIKLMSIQSDDK